MQEHSNALIGLLDERSIISDTMDQRYHVDWGAENPCSPALIIRPENTAAVSKALHYCNEHQLPIVTQGGMTGLCGGATPQQGEIVLSLERLNGIIELDRASMTMTVRAGTPLQIIQQAALEAGLRFPLDLGARGSCHIGGNAATNAGGNQVVRFGSARPLILGLEAVTADGTVVRSMNQMLKNNAGYDLKQLFIGSEGTLGIITELVLRLFPASQHQQTAFCAMTDFDAASQFLRTIQGALPSITTFEVLWSDYVTTICNTSEQARHPFEQNHPMYVLLEAEGGTQTQFEAILAEQMETGLVQDAVIANNGRDRQALWAIRDGIADLLAELKGFANFDIGLPISRMQAFVDRADAALRQRFPTVKNLVFGHMADGNLHLITWTETPEDVAGIYDCVYEVLAEFGGTVTAEHGIGMSKRKYLALCRNAEEIELMKLLKTTLDPNGILNPGRIFEP